MEQSNAILALGLALAAVLVALVLIAHRLRQAERRIGFLQRRCEIDFDNIGECFEGIDSLWAHLNYAEAVSDPNRESVDVTIDGETVSVPLDHVLMAHIDGGTE